jgi:hypothetical protein
LKSVLFPTFGAPTIATREGCLTAEPYHAVATYLNAGGR